MTVIDQEQVITSLKSVTQDISVYGEDFLGFYQFIFNSIHQAHDKLEQLEGLDLIVIEDLYQDYEKIADQNLVLQKKEREVVQVLSLGDFQQDAEITEVLSEILADFLLEYLLIPILNNINYEQFLAQSSYYQKLFKNGVTVYEAKRRSNHPL
jgi:hypothetical protein